MAVPRSPEEFFGSYVPTRLAALSDEFVGKSSPGSVVLRIGSDQFWSIRLHSGAFEITPADASDAIIRISIDTGSFEPLFVRSAERDELAPERVQRRLKAIRALTLDSARANLIRTAPGAVAVVVKEGDQEHRLVATPGALESGEATCTLRLGMDEFVDLHAGRAQPLQLMMTGQLVIEGDAQIVMNLVAALAG
jgi:hypothetical protein